MARTQSGAISHEQLIAAGISVSSIKHLTRRGDLRPYCKGVYLAGGAPVTFLARIWAAVLATSGLVPVPRHARCVNDDLPMTTRASTVLDLVASLPSAEAMKLADRAVQRDWLTAAQLDRRVREQPCRTGNRQLRIIDAQLSDGAAAHSERVLNGLLRRAGIRGWRANHPVWVNGELVAVVDVALPARMIAIEVDGMAFHIDPERFRRDRTRQNSLTACGWTVIRFTWADVIDRPGYVVATLRRFGCVESA